MKRRIKKGIASARRQSLNAQAAVELAVFGSLIIFAFSVLLIYGQRLDNNQRLRMEAFRRALQKAYYQNSAASYSVKQDNRIVDLFSGYRQGQNAVSSAAASAMWVKGIPGPTNTEHENNFAYHQINDSLIDLRATGLGTQTKYVTTTIGAQEVQVLPTIWREDVARDTRYNTTVTKNEDSAKIINTRSSNLKDTVTTNAYTRFDTTRYDQTVDPDDPVNWPTYAYNDANPISRTQGAYYISDMNRIGYRENEGGVVSKTRSWQTNH